MGHLLGQDGKVSGTEGQGIHKPITQRARWSQIVRQAVKIIEQGDGIECVGVGGWLMERVTFYLSRNVNYEKVETAEETAGT